jgi:hypothetical protein
MQRAIGAGLRSCEASRLSVHAGQRDAASRARRRVRVAILRGLPQRQRVSLIRESSQWLRHQRGT